jgi:hypothetical protein
MKTKNLLFMGPIFPSFKSDSFVKFLIAMVNFAKVPNTHGQFCPPTVISQVRLTITRFSYQIFVFSIFLIAPGLAEAFPGFLMYLSRL